MRKFLTVFAAAVTLMVVNGSARAESCVLTGINTPVSATVNITSLTNNQLSFSITNTSIGAVTGKITSIGFDLPGNPGAAFTLTNSSNGNYRLETGIAGNAAGINRTFEFALLTGPNFNGGGNPNKGIVEAATATFTISGNFSGFSQADILSGIFARFQDVNFGGGSDVAFCCDPPPQIPEPATMALLGTGLAGLAAKLRSRRKKPVV